LVCAALVNTGIGDERYHRCMPSDMPLGAVPPDPGQHWGPPPAPVSTGPAQTPPVPPIAFGRPSRWPTFAALAIALVALAVGLVGWFRPAPHNNQPPPKPAYTQQQIADAKADVCTAFGKLDRAVDLVQAQVGSNDHATQIGVAALTEILLDFGGRYLSTTLDEKPATPSELAAAVRKKTSAYKEMLVNYLDGIHLSDPAMQPALTASDDATATIRRLCK
jgi:hypothetical protein